jgi:hypothetical protein
LFVYDPVSFKTVDLDRKIELVRVSADRSGREFFELISPKLCLRFSGTCTVERDECRIHKDEHKLSGYYTTTWHILGVPQEFFAIVRQAIVVRESGQKEYAKSNAISEEVRRSFIGYLVRVELLGVSKNG